MTAIAKIFQTGRSQAVRLPREFRFEVSEVFIRRDPTSGDVILSKRPDNWDDFFALYETTKIPAGFMEDRKQDMHVRNPFTEEPA